MEKQSNKKYLQSIHLAHMYIFNYSEQIYYAYAQLLL